jgi:phosphoribosylformimino-5-aminoimidazole carboxamide ribotide isomerase
MHMADTTPSSTPPHLHPGFTVFPAIDLRRGRVVRLAQGDLARQTVYGDDAVGVARRWQAEGAQWVHVVNLDGAFGEAEAANARALAAVLATGLRVQFGGGLRSRANVRAALEAGVARVVMGTAALEDPALVDWALGEYGPNRLAAGIDARDGLVRLRGWTESSAVTALELARRLYAQGVAWCVFTDVARDGVSTGVNVAATAELARVSGLRVIASGGVAGPQDVRAVRAAGLAGVIVGRALYEGTVDLREVMGHG